MGHTYCSKLSVDSAANNDSTSFDPSYGFPFAGYVNFSKTDVTVNPFEESQDYLQRWDSGSGMNEPVKGNAMCSEVNGTCVKINDMYCSTSSNFAYSNKASFNGNNNKVFLSMVPLARNINSDERGLSFFMDMGSEIKTEQDIVLPYNTNSRVTGCYLDFCAAGFCKSNIPYIGLEYISRMITSSPALNATKNNYYSLYSSSARDDIFGSSESHTLLASRNEAGFVDTYEFPGQGSLLLSPYSLVNPTGDIHSLSGLTSTIYDDASQDCLSYKICSSISRAISYITGSSGVITRNDSLDYTITFDNVTTENTDIETYKKVYPYLRLLEDHGATYYKTSDGVKYYENGLIRITVMFPNYDGRENVWGIRIGSSDQCSLYGNSLSYYLNKGEKFKVGNTKYSESDISVGSYLFVTRSITDTLLENSTNMYTCSLTNNFLAKCNSTNEVNALYNRMDLYPNTDGNMVFLGYSYNSINKGTYTGADSSTFKPRTSQIKNTQYTYKNYIPAFNGIPSWNTSTSKMSNMGVIEDDVEIKFNGTLYVSEVTLVFEGTSITELSEASTISVGSVSKNVKTDGSVNSHNNTEFTFTFNEENSPSKIWSSEGKATNNNMNVYTVGAQQMLKYCSFPGYSESSETSFDDIYRLDKKSTYNSSTGSNINPEDSQMTFTKITGRIPVYISGAGIYKNDSTNVKLISAYIMLTDTSDLSVYVYTLGIAEASGYPSDIDKLSWLGSSNKFKFISPVIVELPYKIHRPFLGSMSGDVPRYTSDSGDSSSYNMGVSSFTYDLYKSKIGLDSSNNVVCVGPNYRNESSANGGTLKTFANSNSAYATDLGFNRLSYNLGLERGDGSVAASGVRGTSVGRNSVYYSLSKNPFSTGSNYASIAEQMGNDSYIKFSLPEPHLNALLVYDSVEFNRASAWTFMRSMPLQPGSANAPHILIYKVEAWVTESGGDIVDRDSTSSMKFDHKSSVIFSGYSNSENSKSIITDDYNFCVKGINEGINDSQYILNNCYLKVDDEGNTEDLNAVGTSFPIRDITGNEDFYGAPSLNAKIYSNITDFGEGVDIDKDNEIYDKLFSRTKTRLLEESTKPSSEGAQIVVLSYCHPELKLSSSGSGDYHKVIYICVGFYNIHDEMIPLNGKFGITYTVTPDGGTPMQYTKYMSLSQFFPKDSMIYLAGKNYKNNTESEANNKFAFVTNEIKQMYTTLSGDGITSGDIPENSEIINIGPGNGISYEISSSSESKGHWGDVIVGNITPGLEPEHYTGHYGILNRYNGKVSFVSSVPYSDYKKYTDSLQGKCLLNYEHICYFSNKTSVVTIL